ncbi:MAG: hypothetical protein WAJ93_11595 [Candidatus Nitrosopolaris sp.]
MRDRIPAGVPLAAGTGGPEPFNYNDVLVIKALICKYICKRKGEDFNRENFFKTILDGEFSQGGAYKDGLEEDKKNGYRNFNKLVSYCLASLLRNELIKEKKDNSQDIKYHGTNRLSAFCHEILKFDMLDVETLVNAVLEGEREIRHDRNSSEIISMLQNLKDGKKIYLNDVIHNIESSTLTKLNQLGIILISFQNLITMSAIGERVLLRLMSQDYPS